MTLTQGAVPQWRDISTAPRPTSGPFVYVDLWVRSPDGTGERVTEAYWLYDVEPPGWYAPNMEWEDSGPVETGGRRATHWMPEPPAPEEI